MKDSYTVRHGGLMRCCLLTLDDAMVAATEPPHPGDTLACQYCKNPMVFRDGAWCWAGGAARSQDAPAP